jgi:hypothetical protein
MPRRANLEPLNGIGEGLLIDLGVWGADADGPVGGGSEFEIHDTTPTVRGTVLKSLFLHHM